MKKKYESDTLKFFTFLLSVGYSFTINIGSSNCYNQSELIWQLTVQWFLEEGVLDVNASVS